MSVTTQITVVGMTCQHCVTAVTEEVSAVAGVSGVDVDLASGRVVITSDSELVDTDVAAAIAEAGYELG